MSSLFVMPRIGCTLPVFLESFRFLGIICLSAYDQQTIILTQKYYGLGQFTRYIRPGSMMIPCSSEALAAYHPESETLTLVLLNTQDREKPVSIDLSAFSHTGASARVVRTSGSMESGEHWAQLSDLPVSASSLSAPLAPNSITTLVIDAVRL